MAEVNIPAGPIDSAPWGAIRYDQSDRPADVFAAAIRSALDGVELGAHDERIVAWLAGWDIPTAVTVASLLLRVRAHALEGRIVLDEPAELGVAWHDGEDLFALRRDGIVMFPGAADEYVATSAEAREWAAQLAAMADARDAAQGGEGK